MDWIFTDDRPIWLQISEQITLKIVAGDFLAGEKLPSVRELAESAGVNPNTMQRALAQLEVDGLTASCRTAGRLVTEDTKLIEEKRRELAQKHIADYLDAMEKLGYSHNNAIDLLGEKI